MSSPYVLTLCPHLMSSPYVLTLCPHLMSSPYVLTLCPHLMSSPYVITLCPHLMSSPYVLTLCPHLMSSPYVLTLCPHLMSSPYVLTLCPHLMSSPYVLTLCPHLICIIIFFPGSKKISDDEFWDYDKQIDLESFNSQRVYESLNDQTANITHNLSLQKQHVKTIPSIYSLSLLASNVFSVSPSLQLFINTFISTRISLLFLHYTFYLCISSLSLIVLF